MNRYVKYCPNVFLMESADEFKKGEIAVITTKYGKEVEVEVFNLIYSKNGLNYYSVVRTDGFNRQEFYRRKAERLQNAAARSTKISNEYYEKSQEGKDFLVLAEPIKVGHHSEKRHRALIERNWNRMGNSVKWADKASEQLERASYWEKQIGKIDLSMPESIEYFDAKYEAAKAYHEAMKAGEIPRHHTYSLTYAKKDVNEAKKKLEIAQKLWGESNQN